MGFNFLLISVNPMSFYCFLISVNPVGFQLLSHQCRPDGFQLPSHQCQPHGFLLLSQQCQPSGVSTACLLFIMVVMMRKEQMRTIFCSDTVMYHVLYSLTKAPLFLLLTNGWIIGRVQCGGEASLRRAEG